MNMTPATRILKADHDQDYLVFIIWLVLVADITRALIGQL